MNYLDKLANLDNRIDNVSNMINAALDVRNNIIPQILSNQLFENAWISDFDVNGCHIELNVLVKSLSEVMPLVNVIEDVVGTAGMGCAGSGLQLRYHWNAFSLNVKEV